MNFDFNGLRLLVVDDNADNRDLFTVMFEQEGAKVTAVSSAREALKVLDDSKVDILVSDILMPDEDGYWLIRQIRSREPQRDSQILAIAVTAAARQEDRTHALLAGFDCHITKPVNVDALVTTVARLSGRIPSSY